MGAFAGLLVLLLVARGAGYGCMEELECRPRLFYSHICGAAIQGATNYHHHMEAHEAVTLGWLCERERAVRQPSARGEQPISSTTSRRDAELP